VFGNIHGTGSAVIMDNQAPISLPAPSLDSLARELRTLRRSMDELWQRVTDIREVLASQDISPSLRKLLGMYPLPPNQVKIERCIDEKHRDNHVVVTAFINIIDGVGYLHSSLVEVSELPDDFVGLDDLQRVAVDPTQFKFAIVKG
jgi:hypothetical protein